MKLFPGNRLRGLLTLIRLPNLLIVALTMLLMRYAVISPLLNAMPVTIARFSPYRYTDDLPARLV